MTDEFKPVDVTTITAIIPAVLPNHLADSSCYVIGYELWMEAAQLVGEGVAWSVTRSTFDVSTVEVDADSEDPNVCAAIMVYGTWYVIVRDGDTIRAARS